MRREQKCAIMLWARFALLIIFLTSIFCGQSLAIKKIFHHEKLVPSTKMESTTENYNSGQLFLKEPVALGCSHDTQQQPGEPTHVDVIAKDELKEPIEEQPDDIGSIKWRSIPDPMKPNDDDLFSSMKNFAEEELNQVDSEDVMENKRDFGYELVNHRFEPDKFASRGSANRHQDHLNNRDLAEELKKNWWTWRNTISYFPSGRARLNQHLDTSAIMSNQPQRRPSFDSWLSNKDVSHVNKNPPELNKIDNKQNSPPVGSSNRGQNIENTFEESSKNQLENLHLGNNVKSENINEIDQQDQVHLREPVMMMPIDEQLVSLNQQQTVFNGREIDEKQATNLTAIPDAASILNPSLNEQRVRGSLLKTADLARQLTGSASQSDGAVRPEVRTLLGSMTTNEQPSLVSTFRGRDFNTELSVRSSSSVDSSDNEPQLLPSLDQANGFDFTVEPNQTRTQQPANPIENLQIENNLFMEPARLDAKFLGFGQLQKNDPIYGNGRTQARLSCQFGNDSTYSNMSLSNVEWAKFSGNYNPYEDGPSFECLPQRSCELRPVKTNALTTVHPRPAVQNYINTRAPSYSVTLHEINSEHLGVYRCSAIRQLGDKKELVYRIITLD